VLLVVVFWATVASAFKITLRHVDFIRLVLWASIASTLVFLIIAAGQKKLPVFWGSFRKHWMDSALLGFLNPFLYYLVLFKAYSLLPAQEAQPLNQTWAIILAILSAVLLKQRITFRNIIALVISFIGVVLISTHGNIRTLKFSDPLGVALALGSAFIWAFYWIYNMKDSREVMFKLLANFMFGSLYILVLAAASGRMSLPSLPGLAGCVYVGFFEMGVTFILWLKALQLAKNTAQITNLIYLVPFLSLVVINLTVGERILIWTVLGLVFIISGIILQQARNLSDKG
jgi:drug/metabolite transporter (DMT)-like permease